MLLSTIILLPLALAHPHLTPRRHHARAVAVAAAARAEVTDRPLVERAGAAIGNDTRDEISAWRHSQEIASTSSAVVDSATGIQGVGSALTAINSDVASATPTSLQASSSSLAQESDAASVPQESAVEIISSQDVQASSTEQAAAVSPSPSAAGSSADIASSSQISTQSSITHTTVVTASRSSTVVRVTASSSASASAAASNNEPEKIAGLNKTTFIIIIVVASVVALMAAGWTIFRKWKLSPSRRFDEKMRPIDFSPDNGDVFMEKTHLRSSSHSSAAMHRQELVAELDSKHVEGVPDHDFTAGGHANMAGAGAGMYDTDVYNSDPYAHAEAYEYDPAYQYDQDPRGYAHEQPTQDTGYADLHRGNSIGSGSGHGHGHGQQYPVESFPMPDHYLNRPLSGDAPYGTSHRY